MCNIAVAPLVGAWIEICTVMLQRTLKTVAPLVGAWIEILKSVEMVTIAVVAPLVGAWIEIEHCKQNGISTSSLLSWERGLKLHIMFTVWKLRRRSSRGSVD